MKLQIKMLNQKSIVVEIEDTKTVYELKKELSLYPDVGVKPELQKLIYAGKILANDDILSTYNIDVKKFLVIMILKQPLEEPPNAAASSQAQQNIVKEDVSVSPNPKKPVPSEPEQSKRDELVSRIVGMGYTDSEVRRALAASFWNPERAIEYLIDGIPTSPSTPDGESSSDVDADVSMSPFEVFRADPSFQALRNVLRQHPEMLDTAIERIGITNPALLNLMTENQQEFLGMLEDASDDEEYEDLEEDDVD